MNFCFDLYDVFYKFILEIEILVGNIARKFYIFSIRSSSKIFFPYSFDKFLAISADSISSSYNDDEISCKLHNVERPTCNLYTA